MGKPSVFRDDSGMDDAVSLHTQHDGEASEAPPAYQDDGPGPSVTLSGNIMLPSVEDKQGDLARALGEPISVVNGVENMMDARCDTDPVYLEEQIRRLAKFAPHPKISIHGSHRETVKKGEKTEKRRVTDFNILIDIQHYICPRVLGNYQWAKLNAVENWRSTYRGGFRKTKASTSNADDPEAASAAPSLTEWCHRYCASHSKLKVFRLTRAVAGMDTDLLRSRLEGIIRSANYRGHVEITFPVDERAVDIYNSGRLNRWRLTNWIRWIFYLTFLWIFTWPYLYFATRRYHVAVVRWPFSLTDPDSGYKVYAQLSEEQWMEEYGHVIRRLVTERYQGEADDRILREITESPADRPFTSGNEHVDSAIGFLRTGLQTAREVQGIVSGRGDGWGYDT